jgi:hypothetical protein
MMFSSNASWTITDDDAAREAFYANPVAPVAPMASAALAVERAIAAADDAPWTDDDGYAVDDSTSRWIERMERKHV